MIVGREAMIILHHGTYINIFVNYRVSKTTWKFVYQKKTNWV